MSKNLSIAAVIEKNRLTSDVPYLLCIEVDVIHPDTGAFVETLRLVRNSENVTVNGQEFVASNFDISIRTEGNAAPDVSVSIEDQTRAVEARMQAYGGGVDFPVRVMLVPGNALDEPPEDVEYFKVVSGGSSGYRVRWTLGADNPLALSFPRRRQLRDRCAWRYKSSDCGYSGSMPSCDLTLQGANGCGAHSNSENFGGYPGINRKWARRG